MNFLAISGSGRAVSTNTALLNGLSNVAPPHHSVIVFDCIADLPVFSPDLEAGQLPEIVQHFVDLVSECDGIIIASPEYIRTIPGGLKNALDWLVSRDEIIGKPIALAHASHRGDDMLDHLRLVLATISEQFNPGVFLRFELMQLSPNEVSILLETPSNRKLMEEYLNEFSEFCCR